MFSYVGTFNVSNKPLSYVLHCNSCGNEMDLLAFKDVKKVIGNRLLLNDNTFIACSNCGCTHNAPEPILNLFNDIPPSYAPKTKISKNNNDFDFLVSAIDWNTWD